MQPTKLTDLNTLLESTTLPDRKFDWKKTIRTGVGGLKFVTAQPVEDDRIPTRVNDLHPTQFGFVIDGGEEYRAEHGTETFHVPEYYNRFSEFETRILSKPDDTNTYAYAITSDHLETCHRIASGGGRYTADDYKVTVCGDRAFVIQTPDGEFLFRPVEIEEEPDWSKTDSYAFDRTPSTSRGWGADNDTVGV